MSTLTIIWSMSAAVALTLGTVHLLVWFRNRELWANLVFFTSTVGMAGVAAAELGLMHTRSIAEYDRFHHWGHVGVAVLIVSVAWFVRLYLREGRLWLVYAVCGLRLLALAIDRYFEHGLNYRTITGFAHQQLFGEDVVVAIGDPNPWMRVGELSSLFLLVLVVNAGMALWKRGDGEGRRRALVMSGSIAFFVSTAAGHSALLHLKVIQTPYFVSLPALAIVLAMGYELSRDVLRAVHLSTELQESEERMSIAAEAANLGLWVWDIPRDDIWTTEKCLALFELAPGTRMRFQTFLDCLHPDDRAPAEQAVQRSLRERAHYETEYRVPLADGGVRWIAVRGRAVFNGGGQPARLLGVCIDITARRRAELAAARQREELAHLSRVAMMGEMASSLAHELNQPLTGITNNASAGRRFIAKGRADFPKLDELLEAIAEDGHRAGEIIRGIRGMVRKGESVRRPVQLNEVVADVLRLVRADALERHCALLTELAPAVPMVEADAVQLRQVVLNLTMNALDAMDQSTDRRLIIRTECEPGGGVRVSVRDFGSGLPAESERVFEQFFSTKREGMGMGLAIARSIIEAHGGVLAATNAEGGGACFHFSLPALAEVVA